MPELIKEIPPGSNAEDQEGLLKPIFGESYKRSKKRKKINPDGFFPGEESYIVKWWLQWEAASPESGVEDSQEARIRTACSTQKPREIQLQIILILETLVLLGQKKAETTDGDDAAQSSLGGSEVTAKKETKPLDFSKILDIMLEKLQIWETTNQSMLGTGSMADRKGQPETTIGDNCLRNFCTEVVVPL